MLPAAINYFKRKPKAKACHVVLDAAFGSAYDANTYKKAVRARKVSAFTRKEYDAWLKAKDNIAEPTQSVKEA